jgi:hypothetical protein
MGLDIGLLRNATATNRTLLLQFLKTHDGCSIRVGIKTIASLSGLLNGVYTTIKS